MKWSNRQQHLYDELHGLVSSERFQEIIKEHNEMENDRAATLWMASVVLNEVAKAQDAYILDPVLEKECDE